MMRQLIGIQAFLILCLLMMCSKGAFGQIVTKGKDFWFASPSHFTYDDNDSTVRVVTISSERGASGTLSMPGLGYTRNFVVGPNQTIGISLPVNFYHDGSDNISNKGIHVEACDSISVRLRLLGLGNDLASHIYPTASLGSEYMILTYYSDSFAVGALGPIVDFSTLFTVVAICDSTLIEIVPTANSRTTSFGYRVAGIPYQVMLMEGETYQLFGQNWNTQMIRDFTGTTIKVLSSKCRGEDKINVFGGSELVWIDPYPNRRLGAGDELYSQMVPYKYWEENYYTFPFSEQLGEKMRILAKSNNTDIYLNGNYMTTLGYGEYFDTILVNPAHISASQPVQVAQISRSADNFPGLPIGDPNMFIVPPITWKVDTVPFRTEGTYIGAFFDPNFYVHVLIPTVDRGNLKLNGAAILPQFWNTVPFDPGYSYAEIPVIAGDHVLTSPVPFHGYYYEMGFYTTCTFQFGNYFGGLPPPPPDTFRVQVCEGDSAKLEISNRAVYSLWSTGEMTHWIVVDDPGIYTVDYELKGGCHERRFFIVEVFPIPDPDLGPDTTICAGDSILLSAGVAEGTYTWHNGSTDTVYMATQAGAYWVGVEVNGCTGYDTVSIASKLPDVSLGNDTFICRGDSIYLTTGLSPVYNHQWSDGSRDTGIWVSAPGIYTVIVEDGGCYGYDTLSVQEVVLPDAFLPPDTTICNTDSVDVVLNIPGVSYLWQDSATSGTRTIKQPGVYWLEISRDGCSIRDTLELQADEMPVVNLGPDRWLCEGDTLRLSAPAGMDSYQWQDGSVDTAYHQVTRAGTYGLTVTNGACMAGDEVTITHIPLPIVDLGPDSTFCEGQSRLLDATYLPGSTYRWHDGSTGPVHEVHQTGRYWVTVDYDRCRGSDTIRLETENCACSLFYPTAFSPDGNGVNDHFRVQSDCDLSYFHMQIFNRWGTLVFETNDETAGWDGTYDGEPQPVSVFVFIIRYTFTEYSFDQTRIKKGNVTLLK